MQRLLVPVTVPPTPIQSGLHRRLLWRYQSRLDAALWILGKSCRVYSYRRTNLPRIKEAVIIKSDISAHQNRGMARVRVIRAGALHHYLNVYLTLSQ